MQAQSKEENDRDEIKTQAESKEEIKNQVDPQFDRLWNAVMIKKRNVFLTGLAGSGKSYLIQQFKQKYFRNHEPETLGITSTTGISALSVGGRTLHSFCGIGVSKNYDACLKSVRKNKEAKQRMKAINILVIDEVSMLGSDTFILVEKIFRYVRQQDTYFGGVKVILTGDFFQLSPVGEDYCFSTDVWDGLKLYIIYLDKVYRFTDKSYAETLSRIRKGAHTKEDVKRLEERLDAYNKIKDDSSLLITPTMLFSKKVDVAATNMNYLLKNKNDTIVYTAEDILPDETKTEAEISRENILKTLDELAPVEISLKIGAQVMVTVNIEPVKGLVNGSRAVVEKLDKTRIIIRLMNGKTEEIFRHQFEYKENDKLVAIRSQFPLILAYALTVHKCQGLSLDCAVISLNEIFQAHQAYVALSRVRSFSGLYLSSFEPLLMYCDKQILNFYSNYL